MADVKTLDDHSAAMRGNPRARPITPPDVAGRDSDVAHLPLLRGLAAVLHVEAAEG